jgi:protein SCO1/2
MSSGPPIIDRAAAFAAGPAKIPRQVVLIVLAVAAGVALLGIAGEYFFSDVGLNPTAPAKIPVASPTTLPAGIPQLDVGLPAFMGIDTLTPTRAPAIALVDQHGRVVTLAGEHGKVVVLTFFNSDCADICPVLASEIAKADVDLGRDSARVVFLTVNTDPVTPSVSETAPAVTESVLSGVGNWYLLGGSLSALNQLWRDYGLSVEVSRSTGLVAHSDTMYFVDPTGRLRYRATPYSNESTLGVFSLPPTAIDRWAAGIATYAKRLLPRAS